MDKDLLKANEKFTPQQNKQFESRFETGKDAKSKKTAADNWDESEDEDENDNNQNVTQETNTTATNSPEKDEAQQAKDDEEALQRLKKKQRNAKNRAKKKKKKKNKQQQQQQQKKAQTKKDDDSSSSDSDSSDDDNKKKKNRKMESYADRMKTDNDILFEGHEIAKKNRQQKAKPKQDNRVMLSGEVTLKNFPLGSARDCENLADQITGLLDQKLFEDAINNTDIFLFYKKLLSADILEKLDMVDTKELCTKMNSLLSGKQKAWHTKKNPKGKKKKKPQWIVADKFNSKQTKKTGHVDGGYDEDEFALFD